MSETTVHASLEYDDQGCPIVLTSDRRPNRPRTDWARLRAMTDEENRANAESDPDAMILTPEQRRRLRRVPDPRAIRQQLGLTQEEFSRRFEIPLGTLRDWEQGRRFIDATARTLLRTIAFAPQIVEQANQLDESAVGQPEDAPEPIKRDEATVAEHVFTPETALTSSSQRS